MNPLLYKSERSQSAQMDYDDLDGRECIMVSKALAVLEVHSATTLLAIIAKMGFGSPNKLENRIHFEPKPF
jgi:hypothetical protein